MNGPEHYAKAELLLDRAATMESVGEDALPTRQAAQVHATLALVAAIANTPTANNGLPLANEPRWDATNWSEVIK